MLFRRGEEPRAPEPAGPQERPAPAALWLPADWSPPTSDASDPPSPAGVSGAEAASRWLPGETQTEWPLIVTVPSRGLTVRLPELPRRRLIALATAVAVAAVPLVAIGIGSHAARRVPTVVISAQNQRALAAPAPARHRATRATHRAAPTRFTRHAPRRGGSATAPTPVVASSTPAYSLAATQRSTSPTASTAPAQVTAPSPRPAPPPARKPRPTSAGHPSGGGSGSAPSGSSGSSGSPGGQPNNPVQELVSTAQSAISQVIPPQ